MAEKNEPKEKLGNTGGGLTAFFRDFVYPKTPSKTTEGLEENDSLPKNRVGIKKSAFDKAGEEMVWNKKLNKFVIKRKKPQLPQLGTGAGEEGEIEHLSLEDATSTYNDLLERQEKRKRREAERRKTNEATAKPEEGQTAIESELEPRAEQDEVFEEKITAQEDTTQPVATHEPTAEEAAEKIEQALEGPLPAETAESVQEQTPIETPSTAIAAVPEEEQTTLKDKINNLYETVGKTPKDSDQLQLANMWQSLIWGIREREEITKKELIIKIRELLRRQKAIEFYYDNFPQDERNSLLMQEEIRDIKKLSKQREDALSLKKIKKGEKEKFDEKDLEDAEKANNAIIAIAGVPNETSQMPAEAKPEQEIDEEQKEEGQQSQQPPPENTEQKTPPINVETGEKLVSETLIIGTTIILEKNAEATLFNVQDCTIELHPGAKILIGESRNCIIKLAKGAEADIDTTVGGKIEKADNSNLNIKGKNKGTIVIRI